MPEKAEATVSMTDEHVQHVLVARRRLMRALMHLQAAEASVACALEVTVDAMNIWDTAGVCDEEDRALLDDPEYDVCAAADLLRDLIRKYAPLAYGETEGETKDLASGHGWA